MDEQLLCRLFAAQLLDVYPAAFKRLLTELKGARALFELTPSDISALPHLSDAERGELMAAKKRGLPLAAARQMSKQQIHCVCIEDQDYPHRLRNIKDPPYFLFFRGCLPAEDRRSIAVIGARTASDYGCRASLHIGRALAAAGVPLISGMARGIDGLAQEACLDAGGASYGILGGGVDIVYPPCHKGLYQKLCEQGGVISEYSPGCKALAWHFPQRNRLISAFADLLLVVEAREKSGSFITVNYALEQGKDVYAIPGRIEDSLSYGCNRLIAQGAGIAYCVEEILLALKGSPSAPSLDKSFRKYDPSAKASGEEKPDSAWSGEIRRPLRKLLYDAPGTAQELYMRLGKPQLKIQELLTELMQLEIEGKILCRGGRYEITT